MPAQRRFGSSERLGAFVGTGRRYPAPDKVYSFPVQACPEGELAITVSYSHAREHLAEIWNQVEDTREAAVLQRRGHEDMALIPADELASLQETAHLLRSPANAVRLLAALTRARTGAMAPEDLVATPDDLAAMRAELGLERDER